MKIKFWLLFILFLSAGCGDFTPDLEMNSVQKASTDKSCAKMNSTMNEILVSVYSYQDLPPVLEIENSRFGIHFSECDLLTPVPEFLRPVRTSNLSAKVSIVPFYFAQYKKQILKDRRDPYNGILSLDVLVRGKESCESTNALFEHKKKLVVSYQLDYPNGEDCPGVRILHSPTGMVLN